MVDTACDKRERTPACGSPAPTVCSMRWLQALEHEDHDPDGRAIDRTSTTPPYDLNEGKAAHPIVFNYVLHADAPWRDPAPAARCKVSQGEHERPSLV